MKNQTNFSSENPKTSFNGHRSAFEMFGLNINGNNIPEHQQLHVDLTQAKCQMGKQCMYVCRSENCEAKGVVCADRKCKCRNSHKKLCIWVDPFHIIELIEQKITCDADLIKDIELKFDELIDEISLLRSSVIEQLKAAGLNQLEKSLLKDLNNNNYGIFKGKLMNKVIENLEKYEENFIKYKQQALFKIVNENWEMVERTIKKQCFISSAKLKAFIKQQKNRNQILFDSLDMFFKSDFNLDNFKRQIINAGSYAKEKNVLQGYLKLSIQKNGQFGGFTTTNIKVKLYVNISLQVKELQVI